MSGSQNLPSMTATLASKIEPAIERGIQRYFDACRARIPHFVSTHFDYPGAKKTNRVAFGLDILRAPVNLFWAPCYTLICLIRFILGYIAPKGRLSTLLAAVPAGFTTQVQKHISDLVIAELLSQPSTELDHAHSLNGYITEELRQLYQQTEQVEVDMAHFHGCFEPVMAESLSQYQVTRTASADIANTLSCTILGAFTFQKFTPGGIGIALMLAYSLSAQLAASDFILGPSVGELYYGIFPPDPSLGLTAATIAFVLTILASCAALSGVITDPIQARTGLHRFRLGKMLNHMENDLRQKTQGSFRPKDQYVARILESFDLIKSGLL
ncbi:DUF6635 family protein [Neptuniibacter pectenicola]|uniref:DUF6635 family protein n=1 Tax=Neptuniibacter pectenicola TaxID=1806669 RepID=A0ABU9TUL0_9GAMM